MMEYASLPELSIYAARANGIHGVRFGAQCWHVRFAVRMGSFLCGGRMALIPDERMSPPDTTASTASSTGGSGELAQIIT
jgi:hypothetical protein